MEDKKISLKQNAFVSFGIFYSQTIIIGAIIMIYVGKFLPDILEHLIYVGLFIFALCRAISSLKSNQRSIIATNSSLMLYEKKKKQDVLLFKIDDKDVEKVEQIEEDLYQISKKNSAIELLPLTFSLKATRKLDLEVRALLCEKYGERAESISNEDVEEYLKTRVVPKEIDSATQVSNSTGMAYAVIGLIISLIPTALALLSIPLLILESLKFVLGLLVG